MLHKLIKVGCFATVPRHRAHWLVHPLFLPPLIPRRRGSWRPWWAEGWRGQRQEKKKRRSEERGDKCEGRCTDGKPVYRPTCRLCNFNGGSGVSWRIVRSRGATSPGKGGTGCGGNRRRCRHGRKGGRKGGENRSEGGVSQA